MILLLVFYSCKRYPESPVPGKATLADESIMSLNPGFGEKDAVHSSKYTLATMPLLPDSILAAGIPGQISKWDFHLIALSDTLKWDWRLLASIMWQESRFQPNVRSFAGAYGLMQLLPSTGWNFGIDITSSPVNNIRAGVMYLKYLQEFFAERVPDKDERLKFILAAYNAGEGNIIDAMNLASKHGRDPLKWDDNVAYYLLMKTDSVYFSDPVVRNGYCNGYESVNFVRLVLGRYSEYLGHQPKKPSLIAWQQ
ncbi:MAG: transglycosylase SLT domain-containing protein [Bacteroidales bacterium]